MHETPQHATAPLDDFADRVAELAEALATIERPARPRADRQPLRTAAPSTAASATVSMRPRIRELSLPAGFGPAGAIMGVVLLP